MLRSICKMFHLLGAAFLVSQLQFVGVSTIVVLCIISPAVSDPQVVLLLGVLQVNEDGHLFSNLDGAGDR